MKWTAGRKTRVQGARKVVLTDFRERPCLRCDRKFMASVENRLCKSCSHSVSDYAEFRNGLT